VGIRPTQDYRYINEWTKRNAYPLPLITELMDRLRGAKYFSKFDVRWGYNNVRIKDGDQWKAAFKTNRGLFEPMVMFFGLCNSPATFQAMMNDIFKDLIERGVVIVYLDDILIYTDTIEEHRRVTREVLQLLQDNDLFLKPEKCEFEQEKVEYLGLIVSHNHVEMDPVKVQGIADWPTPRKVKDVQAFLGFCNFYRRFIQDFSKVAKPLFDLTQKNTEWAWTPKAEDAFQDLKRKFTTAPILVMPDPSRPMRIECDASDFAWGAILHTLMDDGLWHPTAYISKSLTDAERNYDIHDKELRSIIGALESWRHYLEGCEHEIDIFTDHKNLEYFRTAKKLSRRQARWAQFLTRFAFTLTHKPGVKNRADGLSRRADHKQDTSEENVQTLLPQGLFNNNHNISEEGIVHSRRIRINTANLINNALEDRVKNSYQQDEGIVDAIRTAKQNGPRAAQKGLQDWNFENGYLLYRGHVYVPNNKDLRREIVKTHHDPAAMGHPGRYATLEKLQHNYWWPGMAKFVYNYVDGCATCQEIKINHNPTKVPLQPTQIPDRPFQFITMDFIVELPKSNGYDAVLTVTDQGTKTKIFEACHSNINTVDTADLLIRRVFCKYGLPGKIICDRGTQFTSQVMKAVYESLQITPAYSTAYHPQTDGASERANQWLETYLRAYCNRTQSNWSKYLPHAELAANTRINSSTKHSAFELLHGYEPRWPQHINIETRNPTATERLQKLKEARDEAKAANIIAQEAMRAQQALHGINTPSWKPGDHVWLEGKNLKTQYPTAKLGPKRYGPFKVEKQVGNSAWRITLPTSMKIHPVFHASLLTAYKKTEEHGVNFTRPPPEIINNEEEYEVDQICGVRQYGRWKKWQYLIKWKGYPDSENTWQSLPDLKGSHELIQEWHNANPGQPKPPKLSIAVAKLPNHVINTLLKHVELLRSNSMKKGANNQAIRACRLNIKTTEIRREEDISFLHTPQPPQPLACTTSAMASNNENQSLVWPNPNAVPALASPRLRRALPLVESNVEDNNLDERRVRHIYYPGTKDPRPALIVRKAEIPNIVTSDNGTNPATVRLPVKKPRMFLEPGPDSSDDEDDMTVTSSGSTHSSMPDLITDPEAEEGEDEPIEWVEAAAVQQGPGNTAATAIDVDTEFTHIMTAFNGGPVTITNVNDDMARELIPFDKGSFPLYTWLIRFKGAHIIADPEWRDKDEGWYTNLDVPPAQGKGTGWTDTEEMTFKMADVEVDDKAMDEDPVTAPQPAPTAPEAYTYVDCEGLLRSAPQPPHFNGQCWSCKQWGHFKRDCPNRHTARLRSIPRVQRTVRPSKANYRARFDSPMIKSTNISAARARLSRLDKELAFVTTCHRRARMAYLTALRADHGRTPVRATREVPRASPHLKQQADEFLKALFDDTPHEAPEPEVSMGPRVRLPFPIAPRPRCNPPPQIRGTRNAGSQTASTGAQFQHVPCPVPDCPAGIIPAGLEPTPAVNCPVA
jgi:hypothetical protein